MMAITITAFAKLLLTTCVLVLLLSACADSKKKKEKPKKDKYPPGSPKGPDYCDKTKFKCYVPEENDQHLFCDCDKYTREIYQPENMTAYRAFGLEWHNYYRNRIALDEETLVTAAGPKMPAASNMIALSWNYVMEDLARCNARKGVFPIQHDQCHDLAAGWGSGGGQNIFLGGGGKLGNLDCKFKQRGHTSIPHCDVNLLNEYEVMMMRAIFLWYDEMEDIRNLSLIDKAYALPPGAGYQIGHVITLLWANTAEVGCGSAYGEEGKLHFYTCEYFPAGYILQEPMYKKGKATSECPANYPAGADDRYRGLCGSSTIPPAPPASFFISYVGTKYDVADDGRSFPKPFSLSLIMCAMTCTFYWHVFQLNQSTVRVSFK